MKTGRLKNLAEVGHGMITMMIIWLNEVRCRCTQILLPSSIKEALISPLVSNLIFSIMIVKNILRKTGKASLSNERFQKTYLMYIMVLLLIHLELKFHL